MRNIVDQADEIIAIAPWSGQNDATESGHRRAKVTLSRFQIDLC